MHQMKTMNKSWSDPNISHGLNRTPELSHAEPQGFLCPDCTKPIQAVGREAKKDKTAPEIFHLKKLSRKIYVKPPTVLAPAPAPPPKPKAGNVGNRSRPDGSMPGERMKHSFLRLRFHMFHFLRSTFMPRNIS